MNTIKFNKQSVKMVAHRGLSGLERENTCAAFAAAGNRSYWGVETDIWRTADGKFVTLHDGHLARVGGEQISAETVTAKTLQSVTLYDMDGTKGREDLRVPLLENYISICKKYEKICILELKSDFTPEETERFVQIIRDFDYLEQTVFISFNYENLRRVRAILPEQRVQFLTGDGSDEMIARLKADGMDIDIQHGALTRERIDAMHQAGLEINCWTVDDPARAEELAAWGVDYITSNILE
jgi:glycerophosphoryl diester phosphodiesterase